jgi:hypothetical protein
MTWRPVQVTLCASRARVTRQCGEDRNQQVKNYNAMYTDNYDRSLPADSLRTAR